MGLIPNTGTAIQMGRVRNAYGLSGAAALRSNLGAQVGVTTTPIPLSSTFGGRTTPNNY
jgi:hypothetical protein